MREKEIYLDEICGDSEYSVEQLQLLLKTVCEKYGRKSIIRFDAGYNNVSCMIKPEKKFFPKGNNV